VVSVTDIYGRILGFSSSGFPAIRVYYDTDRKAAGSIPDKVIGYSSVYLILPASNTNEYQEPSWR
jgi:hypothetical protein